MNVSRHASVSAVWAHWLGGVALVLVWSLTVVVFDSDLVLRWLWIHLLLQNVLYWDLSVLTTMHLESVGSKSTLLWLWLRLLKWVLELFTLKQISKLMSSVWTRLKSFRIHLSLKWFRIVTGQVFQAPIPRSWSALNIISTLKSVFFHDFGLFDVSS